MTIEEERFLIDIGGVVIRVEVGIELVLADFMEWPGRGEWPPARARWPTRTETR